MRDQLAVPIGDAAFGGRSATAGVEHPALSPGIDAITSIEETPYAGFGVALSVMSACPVFLLWSS